MQTFEQEGRVIVDVANLGSSNKNIIIHILHVDDDATILEISKLLLMEMGNFEIDHACCVDEAFKKLLTGKYDVVISDYEMPQKNGLHFLTELRKQNNNIPFILFTGKGREEVAIKALNLGADGYYNKQGNPETVYGELAHGIKMSVEHWKSKQQLIDRELKYQNIFNNSEVGMFRTKLDGSEILDFNEKYQSIFGLTREEMQGKHSTSFWADPLKRQEMVRLLQANGQVKDFECKMLHKQLGIRNCLTSLKFYPEQGIIEGTIIDISERKEAEEKLKESEKKYQATFESSMDALMLLDEKGFFDCNKATLGLFGCRSVGEFTKFHPADLSPPTQPDGTPSMDAAMSHIQKAFQTGTDNFFWIHKRTDGTIFPADVLLTRMPLKGQEVLQASVRDVTARKQQEGEIESLAKFPSENPNPVFRIDGKGKILYGNDAGAFLLTVWNSKVTQYAPEKIIKRVSEALAFDKRIELEETFGDKTFSLMLTPIPKEGYVNIYANDITEQKKVEAAIKFQTDLLNHVGQAIMMVDDNRTIRFWNKAAEKLYGYSEKQAVGHQVTEIIGVTSPAEPDEVAKRLKAGESWSTEILTKKRDGSLVPVILNRTPIYNENKEFIGAASVTTDITLQKNTEADLMFSLETLASSLDKIQELNEKLRVVGGLTRHDARNKLSAVTGYAYIIKKKHGDQTDIVEGLGKIEQAVKETVRIFDFAKMYEQIGSEELTYVNVKEKLNEAVALFSGPTPIIMNECYGLTVLADSFLRQMLYNFIDNTIKYGKKTTTIKVYFEIANQDCINLFYEDDGVGVPFENKPHLFKEGFSTGGSTGFGLFSTKKMIDVYGWTITEIGEPEKGVKFKITIPKLNKNGNENFQIAH